VPLATLATFAKLVGLGATPTALAAALKPSAALVLDGGRARVRRATPLPPPDKLPDWRARSMYVRGWTLNTVEPTIEAVRAVFAPYGTVTSVRARRWSDKKKVKHFRGSVFVEFDADEAADRVLAEDAHTIDVAVADTLVDTTKTGVPPPPPAASAVAAAPNAGTTAAVKAEIKTIPLTTMSIDAHAKKKADERTERIELVKARAAARREDTTRATPGVSARELTPGMVLRLTGLPPMETREDLKEAFES